MPRGKAGHIPIRTDSGEEVVGQLVHAECVIPVADVPLLRAHARSQGMGYSDLLCHVFREALAPVVREAREQQQERAEILREKAERAEELRRLIAEQQEELRRLERETRR